MDQDQILRMHRNFSEILYDLHKHGDAILNALLLQKGKKAVKKEPLKTIYKTIRETCDYAHETLTSEVKHQLDGLLFFQAANTDIDQNVLAEVYYNRSAWLASYANPPPSTPSFDITEDLTEADVAYLCNYCRIYRESIQTILQEILTLCENEPLYSYRHAHKALMRVIQEQEQTIEKLYTLLNQHLQNIEDD